MVNQQTSTYISTIRKTTSILSIGKMKVVLFYFLFLINSASSLNAFINATTMSNMIKENGNAAIIMVFCKAVSPLTDSKMSAIDDWIIPQTSLTMLGGVKDPFVDCIPRTNVAESADVIKNEAINKIAATERINDNGIALNISKIVNSVGNCVKSRTPVIWMFMAVVPNAANQKDPITVGTMRTPIKNSLIVRPFETRAINILTNGAHAIHQAQ